MVDSFYQTLTSFCFILLGLWWGVMQFRHDEYTGDPARRRTAYNVYLSFLLPGIMGLASQLAADQRWIWQSVFATAGAFGAIEAIDLARRPARGSGPVAWAQRARWLTAVLYILIGLYALYPSVAGKIGIRLRPLQIEGLMVSLLVFLGVQLAWSLLMEPKAGPADPASPAPR